MRGVEIRGILQRDWNAPKDLRLKDRKQIILSDIAHDLIDSESLMILRRRGIVSTPFTAISSVRVLPRREGRRRTGA